MAEGFARCSTGIIRLFCVVFGPNAGLQLAIGLGKIKTISTKSFLSKSLRNLKEGLIKSPFRDILFGAAFA